MSGCVSSAWRVWARFVPALIERPATAARLLAVEFAQDLGDDHFRGGVDVVARWPLADERFQVSAKGSVGDLAAQVRFGDSRSQTRWSVGREAAE